MTEAERRAMLLDALSEYPNGARATLFSEQFGWPHHIASKYLGLLYNEGKVTRERDRSHPGYAFIYRVKIQAPSIVPEPSTWRPPLRVARRMTAEDVGAME